MNYPESFDQSKTEESYKKQIAIMTKILKGLFWKKSFDPELTYHIAKFCFRSPIQLKENIYLANPTRQLSTSTYIVYNSEQKTTTRLKIQKIWKSQQFQSHNIRQIIQSASNFSHFLLLEDLEEPSQIENEAQFYDIEDKKKKKTIKLVSYNNLYFRSIFTSIKKFQKQNKIDELVIQAFRKLIQFQMMILKVANYDSILYIHTNYELDIFKFLGKKSNLKFYLDYVQGTWKISNNHDLYESKEIIESRGQYQVLQTRQIILTFDDIFVTN